MGTTVHSAEAGITLALERTFTHDTLALLAGGSILRLERVAPMQFDGTPAGSVLDRQINPRASVQWRHDISRKWSTSADAGATLVNPYGNDPYNPGTTTKQGVFPTFGALVAYTDVWGRATFVARRAVAPNLFLAQNTIDDALVAQVAMPLHWFGNDSSAQPKLIGLGTFGVEHTQLIDQTTAASDGDFVLVRLDAAIAYTPRPGITYGLRYELIVQEASASATQMLPAQSFFRNTLLFTFAVRYPDRAFARVPRTAQSVRSDRKDLAPIGAEPVVVDPAEAIPADSP
jgi:hypothetical protein